MQLEYLSLPLALDAFIKKSEPGKGLHNNDYEEDNTEEEAASSYMVRNVYKGDNTRIELQKCSLAQSVTQHLKLLITTGFGEFPGDTDFGCGIWDNDFDNVTSAHKLKEIIRQSLLQSVLDHEKRLGSVRLELLLLQEELPDYTGAKRIKKRIDITIKGILHLTNERYTLNDSFFVGPLSF